MSIRRSSRRPRIAVKKGNKELLDRINSGLHEIERDGTRQRILRKWQSKEVDYVTREWIDRMGLWVALVCVALLLVITQRALAHSRALKKINRELAERSGALAHEIEEGKQAEAALQRAHDTLEQHVAERTAELRQSEERCSAPPKSFRLTDSLSCGRCAIPRGASWTSRGSMRTPRRNVWSA